MELLTFGISVASLIAVVAGGLFLRSYLPSYFTEKGKNLASKEDIAQITGLIEGVKAQYVAEVEKVKATLVSEGQVVERRRRVYEEVCGSLRIFIAGHINSQEAKERFHSVYAAAWLWASDPVLISLNRFLELQIQIAASPNSVEQSVLKRAYTEVLVAMRRDVGFSPTTISSNDFKFVRF
jgi:hypothetical protein